MAYTSPPSSAAVPTLEQERPRRAAACGLGRSPAFVLLFAGVAPLYAGLQLLPFTRPGSVVIAEAKFEPW